jgi:hypothetical protein
MALRDYLEELAQKHSFNLDIPRQALMIKATDGEHGDLVLCVWEDDEERYAIGRVIYANGRQAAGFTCWLNPWGKVVRAVNDFRSNVTDLRLAEADMVGVIEHLYLESDQAEQTPLP